MEGCISQYTRLLYWRDASHNTLDYCIGGMHLTIHWTDTLYYIVSNLIILFIYIFFSSDKSPALTDFIGNMKANGDLSAMFDAIQRDVASSSMETMDTS